MWKDLNMKFYTRFLLLLCLGVAPAGCARHWEPAWPEVASLSPSSNVSALLETADRCFAQAGDSSHVAQCVAAYQDVVAVDPANYSALVKLSTLDILQGTAHTTETSEKSDHFRRAMRYAELAMYTNPAFMGQVDGGRKPWEAASTLSAREAEAMLFWVTALQYEFKEGMNLAEKIVNVGWMKHGLVFLDRISAVAPEFGGGSVEFAKVVCYYALPAGLGGSVAQAEAYMQQAVDREDNWLLPRWARGKYYYPARGEDEKSLADLAWVAAQDPALYHDPYPWRVHFQEDAIGMLP